MTGLLAAGAIAVAGLAIVAAAASQALTAVRDGGRLDVRLRRGTSSAAPTWLSSSIDISEGLLAYGLIGVIAWLTAGAVANSQWVPHSEVLQPVSLVGAIVAILLAKLSPRGTTFWLAMEAAIVVVAFVATANHTGAPIADFVAWVQSVRASLTEALLVSLVVGAWLSCAWLCFWIIRRGNVLLGLLPFAVVIAVEVIDDPRQQGLPLLLAGWMVAAVALGIRLHLARLDRRWRFEASPEVSASLALHGGRVLVVVLALGFLLPPLSRVDLSAKLWPGTGRAAATGTGGASGFSAVPGILQTGYSERVEPGGTIQRSQAEVIAVDNDLSQSLYWRGIVLYAVRNGAWETGEGAEVLVPAAANQTLDTSAYQARQNVHATVKVLGDPQRTLFWPGDPIRTSVPAQRRGDQFQLVAPGGGLTPFDSVYAASPVPQGQTYTLDASYSVATEGQLRTAGTAYPDSVLSLTSRRPLQSRQQIDPRVADLARQVTASIDNPYDQAKAIESYLRTKLKYQLQVNAPPQGADPVAYFLLQTQTGYCEYFASAMGEMLRSLGIPARLVNGYGPGTAIGADRERILGFDSAAAPARVIHASDAHTWVEVYFPTYGWVPFEPTPDPLYPAIDRGAPAPNPPPQVQPAAPPVPAQAQSAQPVRRAPAVLRPLLAAVALLAVAIALLAAGVVVARGPSRLQDVVPAWRRLGWLGARVGVRKRPSDTPLEFTRRLARALPSMAAEIAELGRAYSRSCYRAGGLRPEDIDSVDGAWRRLRPTLLRAMVRGAT